MEIDKVIKHKYFNAAYLVNDDEFVNDTEKNKILLNINIDDKQYRKTFLTYLGYLYKYADINEFEECVLKIYNQNYENYVDRFLSRFGSKLGKQKYNEMKVKCSKSQIGIDKHDRLPNCLEYWIKKGFSEEEARLKINESQGVMAKRKHTKYKLQSENNYRKDNPTCIEYWLSRFEIKAAHDKYEHYRRNHHNFSTNYLKDTLGDDYVEYIAKMKIARRKGLVAAGYSYSSKASIRFFIKIYRYIRKTYNIKREDIFWGIANNKEYLLIKDGKNTPSFYDFVLPKQKIIIEYNGGFYHPRDENDPNYGAHCFKNGKSTKQKYFEDRQKIILAENKGFKVLEIWDNDSELENLNKVKRFIDEFINE